MKVLVVGSGGRCHAIIDALKRSTESVEVFAAPGNDGMRPMAELVPIPVTEVEQLRDFAKENRIDLTIVGPEAALEKGIVNVFQEAGLKIFGPTKEAARIETSKSFAKELMQKYGIPTAAFKTFTDYQDAACYVESLGRLPVVIKYDGLAAGKGVVIAETLEQAKKTLYDMLVKDVFGKASVVIEEYLEGVEFSFMCFVDRENVYPMVLAQDHKRAFDGDEGPNTGGMGAYSGVPVISQKDADEALERIMKPVAKALVEEGVPFQGVLYGGLIKTADGVKVIEFNARFGDPEAEVVIPRLKTDLLEVILNVVEGRKVETQWSDAYTVGIVLASKGYPGRYETGHPIRGLDRVEGLVYHMGTKFDGKEYLTNGGRVLIVVGRGKTLREAQKKALADCEKIQCDNLYYRRDIGFRSLSD